MALPHYRASDADGVNNDREYPSSAMRLFGIDVMQKAPEISASYRSQGKATRQPEPSTSALPLRRNADDYLQCYFEYYYPVYPVLNRITFQKRYEALWLPADQESVEEDEVFFAQLNMVFALGSRFSFTITNDQRETIAERFFRKSREAYSYDMLDQVGLSIVQLLVLTAVYLRSSHTAPACWNTVGLAVRVAQSIGLHTPSSRDERRDPAELQLRRKVWHSCVCIDR